MTSEDVLERSLRILEEAIGPSSHGVSRLDRSYTTGHNVSYARRPFKIRRSDILNLSVTLAPDEISGLFESSTTAYDIPTDLKSLFHQFQLSYSMHRSTIDVFDAILNFVEICTSMIDTLSCGRGTIDRDGNDIAWLVNERNTWKLVYGLYKDRLSHKNDLEDGSEMHISDEFMHQLSEKDLIVNLYKTDAAVREAQLLIDWLERISRDEGDILSKPSIAQFTDKTVAWENTLHQIQNDNISFRSSRDIVPSLDPDAPLRLQKPLHDLDIEDEERLLDQVFFEIRRGQLEKGEELCVHCGQAWRAATLEGWRLHHDPNYKVKSGSNEGKALVEGNPNRDIWKLCAWRVCEDARVNPTLRAIMGSLCGHLDALLPMCSGWEDLVWAYARVMVDIRVEREIRDNSLKDYIPLPEKYWNNQRTLEGVFNEVRGTNAGREESNSPVRVIQEMIALDKVQELLVKSSTWLKNECQPQFLRFLTHLVLVLRLIGRSEPAYLGDAIIKAYVKSLIQEDEVELIAFYSSVLPPDDQVELYASYMELIYDPEQRVRCLKAAEQCNLNISKITERVVHNIRRAQSKADTNDTLVRDATEEDLKKISALDWMVYYPKQRANAIWEANALIRLLIGQGKLSAARKAFNKIPPNSVEHVLSEYKCPLDQNKMVDTENLPPKVNSSIKEYLCFKAYLDAQEGFSNWFHQFHNTKPVEPKAPDDLTNFTDRVAYEHRTDRYKADIERWKISMGYLAKTIEAQLMNILMFPDGGWLVDEYNDVQRKVQLDSLRKLCIPQVFALLHKLYSSTERLEAAVDLSVLLMDNSSKFYELFTSTELKDFLLKVAESSRKLLDLEKDPFGAKQPDEGDDSM